MEDRITEILKSKQNLEERISNVSLRDLRLPYEDVKLDCKDNRIK